MSFWVFSRGYSGGTSLHENFSYERRQHAGVYSPAHMAIDYEDIVFTSGLGRVELSKYQGPPSSANAAAWSSLYNFGISRISIDDARLISNRTVPIPNDPDGYYAVGLDVFHQLHCLNMIRLRIWAAEAEDPARYALDHELMGIEHIDHCIDSVRQSLMCSSDITPLPFVWSEGHQRVLEVARVIHTCRKFEKVKEWGMKHRVGKFDRSRKVEDPLDHDPDVKGVMTFS